MHDLPISGTITVYTGDGCMRCHMTVRHMDESEIDYRTVNITDDPAAREYLSELGYTAVPVTTVDSGEETVAWHGFSPDKIDRLAQAHARSEA